MFFETTFEQFSASNATRYQPVVRERPADLLTPVAVAMRLFEPGQPAFLFESAEGGETVGRFSLLGINATDSVGGPSATIDDLRRFVDTHQVNPTAVPQALPGGAVGYLSYDGIRLWEDIPQRHEPSKDAVFLYHHFRDLVVFDHLKQRLHLVTLAPPAARDSAAFEAAQAHLDALEHALARPLPAPAPNHAADDDPQVRVSPSDAVFRDNVEKAREYIYAGDIFQVVLARAFSRDYSGPPIDLYRALRMINPSPFMFFLELGDHQVIGASPEDLVRVNGARVETLPIAGTRMRGATEAEDDALSADLLADPKECAEHTMLVDLARNDIGRISVPGSVQVERMMEIQKFSHVIHIVSRVVGELDPRYDALDALCACFPAGTLSGAPKIRAMELIDQMEESARGLYGGSVGYFDGRGNLDTCIAIRTLVLRDGVATIRAGAGLVADSDPESEEQETRNKARAVLAAIELAGRLP